MDVSEDTLNDDSLSNLMIHTVCTVSHLFRVADESPISLITSKESVALFLCVASFFFDR